MVKKAGFTFLEIMVVMMIIGIMTTIVVPRLFYRPAVSPLDTFVMQLNGLVQTGILEAIRTETLHRIMFEPQKRTFTLETAGKHNVDPQDRAVSYSKVTSLASPTIVFVPEVLEVRHFYINGIDDITSTTKTIFFFIGSDGAVQDVTIVVTDVERAQTISLIANPFSGQLVEYDGIKKP